MPRINVEESWFADPRRDALKERVGFVCDSVALAIWRLALSSDKVDFLIKPSLFEMIPHWKEFEECDLAYRTDGYVYVRGSRKRFEWLQKKREAGKKGGEAKRDKCLARAKRVVNSVRPDLPSVSVSDSVSSKNKKKSLASLDPSPSAQDLSVDKNFDFTSGESSPSVKKKGVTKKNGPRELWGVRESYREEYKKRYGVYPAWLARHWKEAKEIKAWCGENGVSEVQLIRRYLSAEGELDVKNKHPLSTLAAAPQRYLEAATKIIRRDAK